MAKSCTRTFWRRGATVWLQIAPGRWADVSKWTAAQVAKQMFLGGASQKQVEQTLRRLGHPAL